jgi:hypothetical protein
MTLRCMCRCHNPIDGLWNLTGVATNSVLEAAAACPVCINAHVLVFLDVKEPVVIDHLGVRRAWQEYERTQQRRPNSWPEDDGC